MEGNDSVKPRFTLERGHTTEPGSGETGALDGPDSDDNETADSTPMASSTPTTKRGSVPPKRVPSSVRAEKRRMQLETVAGKLFNQMREREEACQARADRAAEEAREERREALATAQAMQAESGRQLMAVVSALAASLMGRAGHSDETE